jgi:hypothetical protein
MRFKFFTSSIVFLSCTLVLAGCDSLGLHNPFATDQVPDEVKAEPRLVTTPPPVTPKDGWRRLGDVPVKPRDFSPKPTYDHYMDELEYHRAQSEAVKKQVEDESPALPDAAPQNSAPQGATLSPPQLPQSPKE